ncbi:putative glycerophosphodiester phosphodiesterase [Helianthus annuus]|nr:putative glycerophosphodiester phosphodiesterase [Helianthus annuus]
MMNGNVVEKRVTDLTLDEFFSYGPQKATDEIDDHSCTLAEAFQKVNPCLGFNIELKFDDYVVYEQEYLIHVLQVMLKVVYENAQERSVLFSSFQLNVVLMMKKLQHQYSVTI